MGAGQVVIPKELRDQLGLKPGEEVEFALDGDALCIRRVFHDISHLAGMYPGSDMAAALLEDRAREPR